MVERIRRLRDGDLPEIMRVYTDAVHGLGAAAYDAAQLAAWAPRPPDPEAWRRRLSGLETRVAEAETGLAGFVAWLLPDRLELLFVDPTRARRGLGSRLYREAEAALVRAGAADTLYTEASLVARPFFEHQGFRVIGREAVARGGQVLVRFRMCKRLAGRPLAADGRERARQPRGSA